MSDVGATMEKIRQVLADDRLKAAESEAKQAIAVLSEIRSLSAAVRQLEMADVEDVADEPVVHEVRLSTTTFDGEVIAIEVAPDVQILTYMLLRRWDDGVQALVNLDSFAKYVSEILAKLERTAE